MRCSTSAVLLIWYTFISTTLSLWFVSLPITVRAANEKVISTENTDDYDEEEEESSSSDDYDDIDKEYISILEQVQKLVDNDAVDSTPEEEKARLMELIQSVDDNNIVGPELLKLLVDSIIDEEDDIVIKEEEDDDDEALKEYKPTGLQIWDEDSILEATKGGRLLLVILTISSCDKSTDFIQNEVTLAADMIDESFITLDFNLPTSAIKPLIGIIDNTSENFSHIFGTITHYPALKFIRLVSDITTTSSSEEENEECDNAKDKTCQEESQTSVESGGEVLQTWEYISSRQTAKDIHDAVLLYWYRHVVSNAMSNQSNESTIDSGGSAPIFTFSSQTDLSTFLQTHGGHALKPVKSRRQHHSKLEEEVFNFYMGINEDLSGVFHNYEYINDDDNNDSVSEDEQFTQEIDPYLLLVQCRSQLDYGEVDLMMEDKTDERRISTEEMILLQNQQKAVQDFDQLAEQMATRSDVAFVALNASVHDTDMIPNPIEHVCDGLFDEIGGPSNGDVAFMRARRYVTYSVEDAVKNNDYQDNKQQNHNSWEGHQRKRVIHNIETDWGDGVKLLSPHAIIVPSSSSDETITKQQKKIHGKFANKDPTTPVEYIQSNLVASTIVHSTPTVMWYDKERIAQLAFPWYRKVHAVLFVDMALSYKEWWSTSSMNKHHPSWPSSLHHSSETATLLLSQQRAIQMFYNAALIHRVKRPTDDLVFLIVPSSEIRIMTSFGVDIWTPLDEALFGITDDTDEQEEQEYLEGQRNNGYCNSPNNGESRNILPVMMITDSSGRSGLQSSRYYLCSDDILSNVAAIEEFIDKFFEGTIEPFTRSESVPSSSEATATTTGQDYSQSTNKPNVTILTGNSFESLVMNRRDEHQIIFISSYSCGHCKRFSIFWNELSMLIQAMNWDSVISVMKIDVSMNDVPHEKINAWDLPAVYYFPAYDKQNPIEMTPVEGKTNPQHDYDEGLTWITSGYDIAKWMVSQNKLDLGLLSRLEKGIQHNLDSEIII